MKITKSRIKQLILEELAKLYEENPLRPNDFKTLRSPVSTFKKAAIPWASTYGGGPVKPTGRDPYGAGRKRSDAKERAKLTRLVNLAADPRHQRGLRILRKEFPEAQEHELYDRFYHTLNSFNIRIKETKLWGPAHFKALRKIKYHTQRGVERDRRVTGRTWESTSKPGDIEENTLEEQ